MNPILIVDDEAAIAMLVRRILTEAGYRCQAVTDSRAAANLLEKHFGRVREVPLLYGGSVKPENAATILALDNVYGVLVGGASLQAESFTKIVTA